MIKTFKGLKALAFVGLFMFGLSSLYAQQTEVNTVFYTQCMDGNLPQGHSEADIALLYAGTCGTDAVEVVKSSTLVGDNCNWELVYHYDVKCGEFYDAFKITYKGGDRNAPTLNSGAVLPTSQSGINACLINAPEAPSEEAIAALYSDNCSGVQVQRYKGEISGDDCAWSIDYDYVVSDNCGNALDSSIKITYSGGDNRAPKLRKNAVIPAGDMNVSACFLSKSPGPSEADIAALYEDNCGEVIVVKTMNSKGTDCKWLAVYDYTISDACGNYATPVKITYQGGDFEAPELSGVPEDMTVTCLDELPEAPLVTATDNCEMNLGEVLYSQNTESLGIACEGGIVVRTWTISDACGNSVSDSQTITVVPAPEADFDKPQNYSISCDELDGFQPQPLFYSNGIEGGACLISGEVVGVAEPFEGSCGSFVVNYSFTDDCDRTITESLTVTVIDETAPVLTSATSMSVECDGSGNLADLDNWLSNNGGATAMDACGSVTWSNDFEALSNDCGATGSVTVEFTAMDECGNDAKTSATFTIIDTIAPELKDAQDLTVECDGEGNAAALQGWLASYGGAEAYDACSEVTWSNDFEALTDDCGATGSVTVEFTATDACGNYAKTSATFTIEDTTAPELTSAINETVECNGEGNRYELEAWLDNNGGASASDSCSGVVWSNDYEALSDDCGATGSVTVEFTATDACGNDAKTSATFTIQDTTAPELKDAQDLTVECDGQGNEDALSAWLESNGGAEAYDACSGVVWSNDYEGLSDDCGATGSVTVEFTATDECGNDAKTSATFTIEDTTAPTIDEQASDLTVECDGAGNDAELQAWLASSGGAMASDSCSGVVWSNDYEALSDDCGATGSVTVEFTAVDECGNDVKTSATFTIEDTTAPVLVGVIPSGVSNVDACYNNMPQGLSEDEMAALYTDGCGDVVVTKTAVPLGDDCSWSVLYRYIIADECGNELPPVKMYFWGGDKSLPEFAEELPADLTVECNQVPEAAILTASDDCGLANVEFNEQQIEGSCDANYVLIRTWVATDSCGNEVSHKQEIVVKDTTPPVLVGIIPNGQNSLDACLSEVPEGPSTEAIAALYEDTCSDIVVTKEEMIWGDSCSWNKVYIYKIYDSCGNEAPEVKVWYNGGDQSAPVIECPNDIDFGENASLDSAGIPIGVAMKAVYTDNCSGQGETTVYSDESFEEPVYESGNIKHMLIRSFSHTDECGNTGDCKVMYTWEVPGQILAKPSKLDFTAFPVPFDQEINISYIFEFDTKVTIELYDTKGLLINSIDSHRYVKGSQGKARFDLSRTANQMFYVKLITDQGTVTKKIVSSSPNRRD